jgi:hypothetical protein
MMFSTVFLLHENTVSDGVPVQNAERFGLLWKRSKPVDINHEDSRTLYWTQKRTANDCIP